MFSFGVLLLGALSSKKNTHFYDSDSLTLGHQGASYISRINVRADLFIQHLNDLFCFGYGICGVMVEPGN